MDCPDLFNETEAWQAGFQQVAGVDEVGRGPLAGPVTAAAVILNPKAIPDGLNDSKKLSAKRRESLSELGRQFQRRQIEKEYTAIVWGEMEDDWGEIELPIATDWPNRPKQMICEERGKHALTRFEVLNRGDNRSLVKLMPVTGRSHQLRIHMQSLGHPIIGCDMYAHPEALEASDRLLLHATRLKLCAPSTGNWLSAFSPIPFGL